MKLITANITLDELLGKLDQNTADQLIEALEIIKNETLHPGLDFDGMNYARIVFPTSIPVILSNGFDGGFDYEYELTLFENIMQNSCIKQKIEIEVNSKSHINYLIEKMNETEPAFCFLRASSLHDLNVSEELIMVEII